MHDELVERRRWIGEDRFLRALGFCTALPGPEAQQLATYVGYSMHGARGGVIAGGLFVLPSFVLLCVLSAMYVKFGDLGAVDGIVRGLGAAVVALIAAAVIRVGRRAIRSPFGAILAILSFLLILLGLPFPLLLIPVAGIGYVVGRVRPGLLGGPGSHAASAGAPARAAHLGWRHRLLQTGAAWLIPLAALLVIGGLVGRLAGFFTLTALVTFGGAYAVLPFVADQAVNHFHWLTADDMVAGLALGESTPGPLIIVNTFVGFLAGYTTNGTILWGVIGASVATLCTFVPSFVLILNGAPFIDRLKPDGPLADMLSAITAAVVGVIAALGVFVGQNVLVDGGRPDWLPIGLAVAAFIALWRFRVGAIWVIGACALVGLLATGVGA